MRRLFGGALPQLVMFDLDGTLVDSVPDLTQAVERMLLALGRAPVGDAQVRRWVGNGTDRLVRRALAGDMLGEGGQVDALYPQGRALFMEAYRDSNGCHSRLYPGARELLDYLAAQSVPQALVTNKPEAFTEVLLQKMGIARYFVQVIGGDTLPTRKPDPAPLRTVLERLGVEPQQALMVGDSRNDVQAARAAGCAVACVSYGYNHGEPISASAPDLLVNALTQLL